MPVLPQGLHSWKAVTKLEHCMVITPGSPGKRTSFNLVCEVLHAVWAAYRSSFHVRAPRPLHLGLSSVSAPPV